MFLLPFAHQRHKDHDEVHGFVLPVENGCRKLKERKSGIQRLSEGNHAGYGGENSAKLEAIYRRAMICQIIVDSLPQRPPG